MRPSTSHTHTQGIIATIINRVIMINITHTHSFHSPLIFEPATLPELLGSSVTRQAAPPFLLCTRPPRTRQAHGQRAIAGQPGGVSLAQVVFVADINWPSLHDGMLFPSARDGQPPPPLCRSNPPQKKSPPEGTPPSPDKGTPPFPIHFLIFFTMLLGIKEGQGRRKESMHMYMPLQGGRPSVQGLRPVTPRARIIRLGLFGLNFFSRGHPPSLLLTTYPCSLLTLPR
jgi:hypothetical protein